MGSVPTTREGYDKMMAQLHVMEVERPKIAQLMAEARAEGDLRENAEYHGQRENLAHLEARINALRAKIADAYIVDPNSMPKGIVAFGSHVKLRDLDADFEEEYILVGPGEEDYTSEVQKILCTSPLGASLMNKKVGDRFTFSAPGGPLNYEVLSIE